MANLFARKTMDVLLAEAREEGAHTLQRSLGPFALTALGIGAVIGAGIFVLKGIGAHNAGPALILSYVLSGLGCVFAGLCYAEFAAMIPLAGSAYTYAYATLGEIFAWIIGWDLILEYAVSNMAVAVGFSNYLNDLLDNAFHIHLPAEFAKSPIGPGGVPSGSYFNLMALVVLLVLTWVLVRGIRESA